MTRLIELVAVDPHAPTAIRSHLTAIDYHLADSLVALDLDVVRNATSIADLGSGAGFPGLPIAIALADAQVALVDANNRKCAFLERAVAMSTAGNATVVHARAETWTEGLQTLDLVTARALAPMAVVAEYAAPLLRVGGTLVTWRGRRDRVAEHAAAAAASELGLDLRAPVRVRPFAGAEHRFLHVMCKVSATPPRFPRRAGAALKRPLGSNATDGHQGAEASDRERR